MSDLLNVKRIVIGSNKVLEDIRRARRESHMRMWAHTENSAYAHVHADDASRTLTHA